MIQPSVRWIDQVGSTQDAARAELHQNTGVNVIVTKHQTAGRGRFDRTWISGQGDSLTASFIIPVQTPSPWLIGMTIAIGVARTFGLHVQWPNDLVALIDGKTRKVGGILSEIEGAHVIVGIGINLNQESFPSEVSHRAASLRQIGTILTQEGALEKLIASITASRIPTTWQEIESDWTAIDLTPGKQYRLPDGTMTTAVRIDLEGALVVESKGRQSRVLAADALYCREP